MIPWSIPEGIPLMGRWTLEESERYCLREAISHYENFPVVAGIVGKGARRTLAAVYCFARQADDFADEPCYEGVRLHLLAEWERQLWECVEGRPPAHPVFIALRAAIMRHNLDVRLLTDLISAFRQDCTKNRYETLVEVFDYCRRSANPVGRIVLRVMGKETPETVELSDRTCTALQLINFWQDLSVDRIRNRLYVPREMAAQRGVDLEAIVAGNPGRGFLALMNDLVEKTREMMLLASSLPALVGFPGEFYLRAVQKGGLEVLGEVAALGGEILHRRPALTMLDMARIFMMSAGEMVGRMFAQHKKWQ